MYPIDWERVRYRNGSEIRTYWNRMCANFGHKMLDHVCLWAQKITLFVRHRRQWWFNEIEIVRVCGFFPLSLVRFCLGSTIRCARCSRNLEKKSFDIWKNGSRAQKKKTKTNKKKKKRCHRVSVWKMKLKPNVTFSMRLGKYLACVHKTKRRLRVKQRKKRAREMGRERKRATLEMK